MAHTFNKNLFFQRLNDRIDKPIDFNHLLAQMVGELIEAIDDGGMSITYEGGLAYHYHDILGKTISFEKQYIHSGWYGHNIKDRYLKVAEVPTAGDQGVLMSRKGTIIGIRAKSRSTATWTLEIRKNGAEISIVSLDVIAGGSYENLVNIDFEAGDWLQIYLNGSNVTMPIAQLEVAWRIDDV